ncbi:hypothetical protein LR48_Vigan08g139800 [Vigna angularis]|uniref:Uncharacterized protein n=1 Tax=Phaseolus angularis TaxID=3914 RepID=A0A0L9V695_PHAAN|nr:hypothetical protein LR48_Vigan08g139800 [Vigna angularis]
MTPETLQRAPSRRRRSCRRRSGGEIQDSEESQRTEEAVIAFAAREDDDDKAKPSTTSFVDGKEEEKHRNDLHWKQTELAPPPVPRPRSYQKLLPPQLPTVTPPCSTVLVISPSLKCQKVLSWYQ